MGADMVEADITEEAIMVVTTGVISTAMVASMADRESGFISVQALVGLITPIPIIRITRIRPLLLRHHHHPRSISNKAADSRPRKDRAISGITVATPRVIILTYRNVPAAGNRFRHNPLPHAKRG
jgi:hypothetical protein